MTSVLSNKKNLIVCIMNSGDVCDISDGEKRFEVVTT
jgi:hypothetical protein